MRTCRKCQESKEEELFTWRNKAAGQRTNLCKSCSAEYSRNHYNNDKQYYLDKAQKRGAQVREENRLKLFKYLSAHPCVDCGESDIIVLEFDHREPLRRQGGRISSLMANSWKRIEEEIEKCDVVCANCHTRRTAKMMGWFKLDHI